jgi:hypothetical protein
MVFRYSVMYPLAVEGYTAAMPFLCVVELWKIGTVRNLEKPAQEPAADGPWVQQIQAK